MQGGAVRGDERTAPTVQRKITIVGCAPRTIAYSVNRNFHPRN
jgi:hypothetical protein